MTGKRFKMGRWKYQNGIIDTKTGKKYLFSPYLKQYDIHRISEILNDVIE